MVRLVLNNRLFKFSVFLFFLLVFLFARSFMGVYIFGFRIGELSMGFSLLIFVISLMTFLVSDFFNDLNKKTFFLTFLLVTITFIINIFLNGSPLTTYTFRSSSYIWTTGFYFLDINISKLMN